MANSTPTRRSKRARLASKRYTDDAFEGLDMQGTDLMSISNSEGSQQDNASQDAASESTDEAYEAPLEESIHSEDDLDDLANGGLNEDDDDGDLAPEDFSDIEVDPESTKAPHGTDRASGLRRKAGKVARLEGLLGTHNTDHEVWRKITGKWGHESALPTRLAGDTGSGGFASPFRLDGKSREEEAAGSWHWYHRGGGKQVFEGKQVVNLLSPEEAKSFNPPRREKHTVLVGPYAAQKMMDIGLGQAVHLRDTWPPMPEDTNNKHRSTRKDGWLLNLGSRIRCLAWAPNHHGSSQYLAVSIHKNRPSDVPEHDAFHPSQPWDSCIELWEFAVEPGPQDTGYMHPGKPPRLVQVICGSWGMIRNFKWCPAVQDPTVDNPSRDGEIHIGLLAGISTDGHARVLDIRIPTEHNPERIHCHYVSAAFEVSHPTRVCTALDWHSDKELLVGLSSGEVGLFDVSKAILLPGTTTPEPVQHIDATPMSYPLAIVSLAPMFIGLFAMTTLGGHLVVVDTGDAERGIIMAPKTRYPTTALSFCAHMFSLAVGEDDEMVLRGLKWLLNSTKMLRAQSELTCISSALAHPGFLVGSADGSVVSTSAVSAFLLSTMRGDKLTWFKHEWREVTPAQPAVEPEIEAAEMQSINDQRATSQSQPHVKDHAPQVYPHADSTTSPMLADNHTAEQPNEPSAADKTKMGAIDKDSDEPKQAMDDQLVLRQGISRITEGYRVETTDGGSQAGQQNKDHVPMVLHEEETAITQVEWNPNIYVGGWAAAGMGSGLLRVEDLAI